MCAPRLKIYKIRNKAQTECVVGRILCVKFLFLLWLLKVPDLMAATNIWPIFCSFFALYFIYFAIRIWCFIWRARLLRRCVDWHLLCVKSLEGKPQREYYYTETIRVFKTAKKKKWEKIVWAFLFRLLMNEWVFVVMIAARRHLISNNKQTLLLYESKHWTIDKIAVQST